MRKIRLIQIGNEVTTTLSNVTVILERLQNEYIFELSDKTIKLDKQHSKKRNNDEYLSKLIQNYMLKNKFNLKDYPIAIIDKPIVDELISVNDNVSAIISTYPFRKYSKINIVKCLLHTIASILPDIGSEQITSIHDETRRCPNDYCDKLEEMDLAISKGEYCQFCHKSMMEAVEKGIISVKNLAAIYRILDYAADRKICFVIMPFSNTYDKIYNVIRKTMKKIGYECLRADEIFETRNIIDVVNERIIRAELIIADLTKSSPNVFYELGYAHAYGKNTILMAQNENDVPFDLRHRQYFIYETGANMNDSISSKLKMYVRTSTNKEK